MRYLGIDFGTKHIGLSISEEGGTMAFPHKTLSNDKHLIPSLCELIKEKGIEGVVIGESKDFKGNDNPILEISREFAKKLSAALEEQSLTIEIYFEPEFMTSVEARHIQGGGEKTHASASALILQSFLDKKKHTIINT